MYVIHLPQLSPQKSKQHFKSKNKSLYMSVAITLCTFCAIVNPAINRWKYEIRILQHTRISTRAKPYVIPYQKAEEEQNKHDAHNMNEARYNVCAIENRSVQCTCFHSIFSSKLRVTNQATPMKNQNQTSLFLFQLQVKTDNLSLGINS